MGKELVYPQADGNLKDDPAIIMARNSLKRKPEKEVVIEKKQRACKSCWRCKAPVGRENLKQKWIRRLNAQRFICDECIPLKDELAEWENNLEEKPITLTRRDGVQMTIKKRTPKVLTETEVEKQIDSIVKEKKIKAKVQLVLEKVNLCTGEKYDYEKLMMNLLPFESLEEVSKVLTFGAKKYSPDNWKIVPDAVNRYEAALIRHLSAYKRGERIDPETGLSHLAHAACNSLFLVWFELNGEVN